MSAQKTKSTIGQCITLLIIIHYIYPSISEVINCDNNWADSPCHKKSISCNATSPNCTINCNGVGSCDGALLNCNANPFAECNINCRGSQSCGNTAKDSRVQCPMNGKCNIDCSGDYSCDDLFIECGKTEDCAMQGNGQYSLADSHIFCPTNAKCVVHCNNLLSCFDAEFNGNSSNLTIHCANNKNACKNMIIGCPKAVNDEKRCKIIGDEGTLHEGIRFFAFNSWDDIDLTLFTAKTWEGNSGEHPLMSCGNGLNEQCILSKHAWNCEDNSSLCYRSDIQSFPTPMPTNAPSDEAPISDGQKWGPIIGIIIGIFMFCLFVILGWVWCIRQQQKEKTKYETIDTAADPDEDVMQKDTQHMYKGPIPNKNRKSMDVETKGGLHIVNEYSDASKFGGLLPISEENTHSKSNNIVEERQQTQSRPTNKLIQDGKDSKDSNGVQ